MLISPQEAVPTSGPVEPALVKYQRLLSVALAMVGAVHLVTVKRFHHRFQQLVLAVPRDSALRGPNLAEVWDADRSVWAAVCAVMTETRWGLNDSLNEISYCRQETQSVLQP